MKVLVRDHNGVCVGTMTEQLQPVRLEACNVLKSKCFRQAAAYQDVVNVLYQIEVDLRRKYAYAAADWVRNATDDLWW